MCHILIKKFQNRTEYVQEVFSTNQREIKVDNAVYCVQRHFLGESSVVEIIARKISESPKNDEKFDIYKPINYNNDRKLVQGG